MMTTRSLIIFEGVDGVGKTTAAQRFADEIDAHYVHFPALKLVTVNNLARMYVEAMMPALLGHRDVVFDRSWLSEVPYGDAFRNGLDRLGDGSRRMLERLAMRCGVVVVHCQARWPDVLSSYERRSNLEMLDDKTQLRAVFDAYECMETDMPTTHHNYRMLDHYTLHSNIFAQLAKTTNHVLAENTAGNKEGRFILVGESIFERTDFDPFYQWPFASFGYDNCCQWITGQLDIAEVGEDEIYWVDTKQDLSFLQDLDLTDRVVVAIGNKASDKLDSLNIASTRIPHPEHWRQSNSGQRYPLHDVVNRRT